MVTKRSSPDIEECAALYLDVWELFETRAFEPGELAERLVEHDREIAHITGDDEPERHLDVLVEYGLVTRDDGQYRIRCTPEEDVETWRETLQAPPEAIYRLVQRTKRQREKGSSDGDEWDVLERNRERFVSVYATRETDVMDLISAAVERLGEPPQYDGIVVRTPAIHTGHVQRLADDLCDADVMAETGVPYHFEKITSNVRGEHKDALEYRLYLRPIS